MIADGRSVEAAVQHSFNKGMQTTSGGADGQHER
jgi:hypothetical protein